VLKRQLNPLALGEQEGEVEKMENNQLTRKEQTLLVEYQVCEQDSRSRSHTYWLIFSIFIGINTALLGWLYKGLITKEIIPTNPINIIIIAICWVMILILLFMWFWLSRTNWFLCINDKRMREIERLLDMRAKRIMYALDNPNPKERFDEEGLVFAEKYKPEKWRARTILKDYPIAIGLFLIIFLSWVSLICTICWTVFDC